MARGPRHPEALVGVTGEEGRPGRTEQAGNTSSCRPSTPGPLLGDPSEKGTPGLQKAVRTSSLQGQGDSAPQPGSTKWREQSRPPVTRGLGGKFWVTAPGHLLQAATKAVLVKLGEVRAEGHPARHRHPLSRETFTQ